MSPVLQIRSDSKACHRPNRLPHARYTFQRISHRGRAKEQTFFITVVGQTPVAFDPNNPPAITTTQGSLEDWTIQNRSEEIHEFHIHQTHFLLLEQNGKPLPSQNRQLLDTVNVPFWSGKGPYPSVKVRIDFRGPIIGDFVYHCHILEHEDGGMMAIIRVIPPSSSSTRGKQRETRLRFPVGKS
jgi:FtsP/CotA-like multicopper oxidase with cupredoxin domain